MASNDNQRGLYIQPDLWMSIKDLSVSSQNTVLGVMARLFFTGEDTTDSVKNKAARACCYSWRGRVLSARNRSKGQTDTDDSGDDEGDEAIGNSIGKSGGNSIGKCAGKSGGNSSDFLKKRERESENISTYISPKTETQPNLQQPSEPWIAFADEAMKVFCEVTGQSRRISSPNANFGLRQIYEAGYSLDDVKTAVQWCNSSWKNEPKMARWIRPETVFKPEKFEGYLNAGQSQCQVVITDVSDKYANAI